MISLTKHVNLLWVSGWNKWLSYLKKKKKVQFHHAAENEPACIKADRNFNQNPQSNMGYAAPSCDCITKPPLLNIKNLNMEDDIL